MAKLVWDAAGEKIFETGAKNAVLFPGYDAKTKKYGNGVAWNGLTSVTESPSGADEQAFYADDIKYGSMRGAEDFGGTIEAYMYPDEWAECDGSVNVVAGVALGQQKRKVFGLCYKTTVGNDTESTDFGYKLHLIYGATASPSEKQYQTMNDSPEAVTMSWEFTTTPVAVTALGSDGKVLKPVALITIDTTKLDEAGKKNLATLEEKLFGTETAESELPTPDEVINIMKATVASEPGT